MGTSIYFAVDNNKTQAVVAEVTADADKIASTNDAQSADVQKLKDDYDDAQKNGQVWIWSFRALCCHAKTADARSQSAASLP